MQIRWTQSASKHGISQEDALNAIVRHRIHVTPYGASRMEDRQPPDLFIGPGLDGRLLEVMAEVEQGQLVVFHVMYARPKTIEAARRMQ